MFTGVKTSCRGVGVEFGHDVSMKFLEANGLELLVRSHQVFPQGFKNHHFGKVITVFPASNYGA